MGHLKIACQIYVQSFDDNHMKAKQEKFQFIVLSPFQKEFKDQYTLDVGPVTLNSVTLLTFTDSDHIFVYLSAPGLMNDRK